MKQLISKKKQLRCLVLLEKIKFAIIIFLAGFLCVSCGTSSENKENIVGHVDSLILDCVIKKRDYCKLSKIKYVVHFDHKVLSDELIFQNTYDPCDYEKSSTFYTDTCVGKMYLLAMDSNSPITKVHFSKDTIVIFRLQKSFYGSLESIIKSNEELIFTNYNLVIEQNSMDYVITKDKNTSLVFMVDDTIVKSKDSYLYKLTPVKPDSTTLWVDF